MAGTIPLSLTQQFNELGEPLGGGLLYIIQAGTVATPQDAFQDAALTILHPNPITLDAAGRIPQFFLDDGYIKVRLTDEDGVTQLAQDNILVIGPSAGGGGGGGASVDPTTILQTGMLAIFYGTGAVSGFARANGRTIGAATSGATERANADTEPLYIFLWNADANLSVSGGRGVSGAADFAALKTLTLPDFRGRTIAGLDDMGNSAAGRLTATHWGGSGIVLGQSGGSESNTLSATHIPSAGLSVSGTTGDDSPDHTHTYTLHSTAGQKPAGTGTTVAADSGSATASGGASVRHQHSFSGNVTGGGGQAHANMQPTMLVTIYLKL